MSYTSLVKDDISHDLAHQDTILQEDVQEEQPQGCCKRVFPAGILAESKILLQLAWPIVLTQMCQSLMGPISLIFCGHLGDTIQLDGAALAITFINVSCIGVAQGLGTSCDTFFSQCYGSNQKKLVGVYVQRAVIIFTMILLIVFVLHLNMESFLIVIGQDPDVARLTGNYMLVFMPGAFFFFMYVILAKYIQNQRTYAVGNNYLKNIVWPNVIIGVIANVVNALLHYLLLYQWQVGLIGSAVSQVVGYFLMASLTLCFILYTGRYKETWDGWSMECLEEWGFFCRLALPGMLMVCMEWWGFEIGTLLTGILGTTELGAQAVILQMDGLWYQVPFGLQIASTQRIGQYLGASNIPGAITVSRLILGIIGVASFIMSFVVLGLRYQLAGLFTNVDEVVQLAGDLIPIVCLYMFFDGLACACKGVLFGTGRQLMGAGLLFVSYYCIALPIGVPLMFLTELRSAAYWWALAINLTLQAIVLNIIVLKTDWNLQVQKAQERAGMLVTDTTSDDEQDAEHENEKTPLLGGRQPSSPTTSSPPMRRMSLQGGISSLRDDEVSILNQHRDSIGLGGAKSAENSIDMSTESCRSRNRKELILKRLMIGVCVLAIFACGIALRLVLAVHQKSNAEDYDDDDFNTMSWLGNISEAIPTVADATESNVDYLDVDEQISQLF